MAIDKLNFSGAVSPNQQIETPLSSVGDRLMKYGANLSSQTLDRDRLNVIEDDKMIQRNIADLAREKEDATQQAMLNYNNAIARTSTLGTMSDEQGKALGDKYSGLVSKFGEEQAAKMVTDEASALAAADAAKLKASPQLAYERVSQLEMPTGNIDPLKLIAMKESKLNALEDRQNKIDDRLFKEKQLTAEQANADRSYNLQKLESQARIAERNADKLEKKGLVKATLASYKEPTDSLELTKDSSGGLTKKVGTGIYDVDFGTKIDPTTGETVVGDNTNKILSEVSKLDKGKQEKAQSLIEKIIPDDKLKDDKVLLDKFQKTEGAESNIIDDIKGFRATPNESQKKISDIKKEIAKITPTNPKNIFYNEKESAEAYNNINELNKKIYELEKNNEKDLSKKTQTFDEFKKNIELDNEKNKAELRKVQNDIDKDYNTVLKDLKKEVGVERTTDKFASVSEVKTKAFNDKYNQIKASDSTIDDASAAKVAEAYANKIGETQSSLISTSKTEGEKKEEKKSKAVEEDIKTKLSSIEKKRNALFDLQKSLITGKDPSDKVANPYSREGAKIRVDDLAALIDIKLSNLDNDELDLSNYRYNSLRN